MNKYFDKQNHCSYCYYVSESVKNYNKKTTAMILSKIDKDMLNQLHGLVFLRYMDNNIPVFKL